MAKIKFEDDLMELNLDTAIAFYKIARGSF